MIQGYFLTRGARRRPFVDATFHFPSLSQTFDTHLLVDTGADRTILGPVDASRLTRALGIALTALPSGLPSTGIGGTMPTRTIDAVLGPVFKRRPRSWSLNAAPTWTSGLCRHTLVLGA